MGRMFTIERFHSSEKLLFSAVDKSAIVSMKSNGAASLAAALAAWTAGGAILGAGAGAAIAALFDWPDVARGAIRLAPACAVLGFLVRLAAGPTRP